MENPEELLQSLDEFVKLKPKEIPPELEEYLGHVAKTGDPIYQWSLVKALFREKLLNVITEFYEGCPAAVELAVCPNVDPFNYETMKNGLVERLESFANAPFTVQRLCELLTAPRKQYSRADKFMRAIEKNMLVVSTREPGHRRTEDISNGEEARGSRDKSWLERQSLAGPGERGALELAQFRYGPAGGSGLDDAFGPQEGSSRYFPPLKPKLDDFLETDAAVSAIAPPTISPEHLAVPMDTTSLAPAIAPDQAVNLAPDQAANLAPDQVANLAAAISPEHVANFTAAISPDHIANLAATISPDHIANLAATISPDNVTNLAAVISPDVGNLAPLIHPAGVSLDGMSPDQAANIAAIIPDVASLPALSDGVSIGEISPANIAPAISPNQAACLVASIAPDQAASLVAAISPDQAASLVAAISPDLVADLSAVVSPEQDVDIAPTISPDKPADAPDQAATATGSLSPDQGPAANIETETSPDVVPACPQAANTADVPEPTSLEVEKQAANLDSMPEATAANPTATESPGTEAAVSLLAATLPEEPSGKTPAEPQVCEEPEEQMQVDEPQVLPGVEDNPTAVVGEAIAAETMQVDEQQVEKGGEDKEGGEQQQVERQAQSERVQSVIQESRCQDDGPPAKTARVDLPADS